MSMNEISKRESTTPGIGVSGLVMCPFFKGACLKGGCELWVELNYSESKVARCTLSWLSILSTETRASIDKLRGESNDKMDSKDTKK